MTSQQIAPSGRVGYDRRGWIADWWLFVTSIYHQWLRNGHVALAIFSGHFYPPDPLQGVLSLVSPYSSIVR